MLQQLLHLVVAFASLAISISAFSQDRPDILIEDFEGETYGDWKTTGEAFGTGPARGALKGQMAVSDFLGKGLVNSFINFDSSTGTLTSPEFRIERKHIAFLIGGGNHPGKTCIELLVGDRVVRTHTGPESESLWWRAWDVSKLAGKTVRIRIADRHTGGWGHINVDHILQTDRKKDGINLAELEAYRQSESYYREPFRPQFHFTPELNWMNDPNGLVFHDGEYHLFYQYNPWGNTWGHMSWGHAVSSDLVSWTHLPVALYEENGIMIFSGCCVVDHENTSGFRTPDATSTAPLVAIYTGHRKGRQDQRLAYSNDRGRTWTKYPGSPVLDIDEADFRDPKVFWHEGTKRWVMVVALAVAKKLQLYGSPDLKKWTKLSEFGPAGQKGKPNWECPDLFELPIENQPGKTRWVLEADMGGAAIAGGSGGEYFLGTFDGKEFKCDGPLDRVLWVDYGRDFYAPVSWSDIPAKDGRRIWVGWMNNWETHLLPTSPWRSAQSIPRALSLRAMDSGGLRLIQRPVRELQTLRGEVTKIPSGAIDPGSNPLAEVRGTRLEILAEINCGGASKIELEVRKSAVGKETTIVGYDTLSSTIWVDRRRSGNVAFHKAFADKIHAAPIHLAKGATLRLHIFVDTSSVEVFADDGAVVITDRIFPAPTSDRVSLSHTTPEGESAPAIKSLEVWPLESIWPTR